MFGRNKGKSRVIDTLVGQSSEVNGDLSFQSGCHVDGRVNGNITGSGDNTTELTISENGYIDGGVTVPHLVLMGTVKGDVYVSERVELGPTARVIGNVYYNLIEMAIGAEINGKLVHQPGDKYGATDETNKFPATRIAAVNSES